MGNKFAATVVLVALAAACALAAGRATPGRGRADDLAALKPDETPAQATKRDWDELERALRPCRFDLISEDALRPDARPEDMDKTLRRTLAAVTVAMTASGPLYRAHDAIERLATLDVDPEAAAVGKRVRFLAHHYARFASNADVQLSDLHGFYQKNAKMAGRFDDPDAPPKVREEFEKLGRNYERLAERLKAWRKDRAKLIKDVQVVRKSLAEKHGAEFQDLAWLRGDAR